MATVTLDSIREGVEKKYAAFEIDLGDGIVKLLNPLRLSAEARKKLTTAVEDFQKDGADPVKGIEGIIDLVAESTAAASKLKKVVGGDLPVLMEVLNAYLGEQKVGEASPSAN